MSIDLHIHSLFSDGTYTPYEIARLAKQLGITAISITDHDTVSGTEKALDAARQFDIEAISGIEMSVLHNEMNLHILGYFVDHNSPEFKGKIEKLQVARKERNKKIIKKLNEHGIFISYEEVKAVSKIDQMGRPHIAQVLHRKGYVKTINEAFIKYLKNDALAYVTRFLYNSKEAIQIIQEAGGFSVLAHPVQIDPSLKQLPKIVDDLVALGLDGLEMYYPTHSGKVRRKIRKITKKHDLLFTGGSDFHGIIRPGTNLASGVKLYVPPELLDVMKQRWVMR